LTLRIKNWAKLQHFKDRTPPWIKLYRDILDDPDWHDLDGDTAKTLIGLWLIASEDDTHSGALPSLRKLAFRLRIPEHKLNQQLTKLSHWLVQDDIKPISEQHRSDAPETETETETETEIYVGQAPDVAPQKSELRGKARELLAFLNAKAGRSFEEVAVNLDRIEARLREGADFHDCKSIIAKKCGEWGTDEKMREYLRPATLFNREKFWSYQGQLEAMK